MVPVEGSYYYSVFPLGAVLSMVPVAILQKIGIVHDFPGRALASLIAGLCVYFFFQLSAMGGAESRSRRILLALFPIFGTWIWCNLGFGGAWHIALGLALLGEIAALYFTLVQYRPLLAGVFFALAIGNRTELALSFPVFIYLLIRPVANEPAWHLTKQRLRENLPALLWFLSVPAALGLATAAYNLARFHSIFDFGYSHIPNVLQEPWYQHGLFSFHAIPWNVNKMLFEGFIDLPDFPYFSFHPFGCSIFLASPFLFLLFREGGNYKAAIWIAIGLLTFALWCHGNPGGWQFSYRYAMILIPWMFILIVGNGPAGFSVYEAALFVVSVAINAVATNQFLWTDKIQP
jgi:hypothetical protein